MKAAEAALSKQAFDILILNVGPLIGITDYFVICSGKTERQVGSIVDEVQSRLQLSGVKPYGKEGEREQRWVLLDFLDLVVHVFHQEEREYYELERLWKDAAQIPFAEEEAPAGEEIG